MNIAITWQEQKGWFLSCIDSGPIPRWSQRRLPLEFMDGLTYKAIIEPAEPLARRRGSALAR